VFALAKRGAGAKPLQERRCHPEGASADDFAPEGSRAAPIYKRGAVPVRRRLMCINVKLKSNVVVRTFERQIIQNHCVILILHSDFLYSYTFSWVGAVQTPSPAPRRPRNNSGVTRSFGRQAVCGRRLRMTSLSGAQQSVLPRRLNTVVFLWKTVRPDGQVRNMGCRPLHPCIASENIAFCFLCILHSAFCILIFAFLTRSSFLTFPPFCAIIKSPNQKETIK